MVCYCLFMRNVNVNLTKEQVKFIDDSTKRYGFANRSEFVRALIRYVFSQSPKLLERLDSFIFEEPKIKDPGVIEKELKKSGKYSSRFIRSVALGLKKSEYFNQTKN